MGYFRFALAIAITAAHLTGRHSMLASCAVWVFYLLSGYLMSLLCAGPYKGRLRAFWVSRSLRVFPVYWVTLLTMVVGIHLFGHSIAFPMMTLPTGPEWLLLNIQHWWGGLCCTRTIPPAWALTVELFWWLLISLGAMDGRRVLPWMVGGTLLMALGAYPLGPLWFSLWGGMLPFALGVWVFQNGLVIPRDGRWGAYAGALSYPIYIAHYGVGAAIAGHQGLLMGWPLFWLSLPATLAAAVLLHHLIEQPIDQYRRTLRS